MFLLKLIKITINWLYQHHWPQLCWASEYSGWSASKPWLLTRRPNSLHPHGPFYREYLNQHWHYNDVIMGEMVSQIANLMIVYSTNYSGTDQRKHQSSTSLAFVRGIHRWPVNAPHKGPVTRKMFPFDDVIMEFPCYDAIIVLFWLFIHIHKFFHKYQNGQFYFLCVLILFHVHWKTMYNVHFCSIKNNINLQCRSNPRPRARRLWLLNCLFILQTLWLPS